jgi:hypothetical protein
MRRLLWLSAISALLVALTGCSKLSDPQLGSMSVRMTDAPGNFDHVNIALTQISATLRDGPGLEDGDVPEPGDNEQHFEVLWAGSRMCDLLQLRNGVFTSLGASKLPAGNYARIRMMAGSGSNVVVGGVSHPLIVPSHGIRLRGHFNVKTGGVCDIALDFDVARSIVPLPDGSYILKPSVRAFVFTPNEPQPGPGALAGAVSPSSAATWVFAIQGADTVASSLTATSGAFQVSLLPAGTYNVAFHPVAGFEDMTVTGVVVANDATTNMGTVALTALPPPPPQPGALSGMVSPAGVSAMVSVLSGGNTVAQTSVAGDGSFNVGNLDAGSYSLTVVATGFRDTSLAAVSVTAGNTTNVGTIALTALPPAPGGVMGRLSPQGVPCTVSIMQNGSVVTSADANLDGTFSFSGLAPGAYVVHIHPQFDYRDMDLNVQVVSGQMTDMGDVPLVF